MSYTRLLAKGSAGLSVARVLADHGAQQVTSKGNAAVYYAPRSGKYIKVLRLGGGGYDYAIFNSRADCGCG